MRGTLANWIGGEWRAAAKGGSYALGATLPGPRGIWPRSGAEDLELALAAAREGGPRWRAWTRAERLELLLDALEPDLFLGDPEGLLAARLWALPREVESFVSQARRRGRGVLGRRRGTPRPPARPAPTTALVRVHGAALFGGLVERVWTLLLEGWAVVLVADPALPMLAREVALALDHADLPPGALSLLCDDGAGSLRAGLQAPGVGWAWVLDLEERGAEVLELAGRPRRGPAGAPGGLPVLFEPLASGTRVVRAAEDPEQAAREVALGALGRAQALSGQREGQVGRVVVHRRLFSRFSAALLAEVDRLSADPAGTLALLDPELPRYVERLRRLGLDEGATLLRGDGGLWLDPRGGPGSPGRGRDGTLEPLVFTNVEPRMRLARAQRPAPLLRLLRAEDDDAALGRADELGPP